MGDPSQTCPVCRGPTQFLHDRDIPVAGRREFHHCSECELWAYLPLDQSPQELRDYYVQRSREVECEVRNLAWPYDAPGTATRTKAQHASQTQRLGRVLRALNLTRTPIRVLDVGCGVGAFLWSVTRDPRFEAAGVEIATSQRERAVRMTGCRVYESLEAAISAEPPFDVVWARHVLEHVSDPVGFAAQVAIMARSVPSVIVVECPNEAGLAARYGRMVSLAKGLSFCGYSSVYPPFHLVGYSVRAVEHLFRPHGFRCHWWTTYSRADRRWFPHEPDLWPAAEFFGDWKERAWRRLSNLLPASWGLRENLAVFLVRT